MGTILAILNNKGGVGKTTVAVNVAHCLATKGKRTLVIDMDAQCNSSSLFNSTEQRRTVYDILTGALSPEECIQPVVGYEKLFILPNLSDTAALEPTLSRQADFGWNLLRDRVRDYVKERFDYVLIDCPPNLGTFSVQAVIASDGILVPVEAGSRYAADGLSRTVNTINELVNSRGQGNSGEFLRIIVNKADKRTVISRSTIAMLQDAFPGKVFDAVISTYTDIKQAEYLKKTVLRHAPQSKGAAAFRSLTQELLDSLE